jgi:hypothetical protein
MPIEGIKNGVQRRRNEEEAKEELVTAGVNITRDLKCAS